MPSSLANANFNDRPQRTRKEKLVHKTIYINERLEKALYRMKPTRRSFNWIINEVLSEIINKKTNKMSNGGDNV